ncbi:hypothetical protein V5O48_012991 [Marasmius crinis-equi]|uniref:Uncharacterized protein n=1 Tax=Marasmius crinis-equi TaxID=585013 RepID=A0ABR3F1B6_9AGAR
MGTSFGFSHVMRSLARASNATEFSDRSQSIATLTLQIFEFVDITMLTSLIKTSCEAGFLAVQYTEQGRGVELVVILAKMKVKVDEMIRTLEETLLFCRSFQDAHLKQKRPKILPQWVACLFIMWKIKKLRPQIGILSHKIQTLMLETQDLAHALSLVNVIQNQEEQLNRTRLQPANIVDRSSSQLLVEGTPPICINLNRTSEPGVHSPGPSQGGSSDSPSQCSPPGDPGPETPPSSTTGFFAGAHNFNFVLLPGASISFAHVNGDQSIITNSRNTSRAETP